eukprot:m.62247 g.62247  ORF g.62247 m.62247 type:complete len:240 (-) comp8023_c4_seq1:22-741(-)
MTRRRGVAALKERQQRKEKASALGQKTKEETVKEMAKQIDLFKTSLEGFATKYRRDIKKNADFRADFQIMCTKIGVDPLASNNSFWGKLLGVGNFYFKVGVQVVEACILTRGSNGGIISIEDLTALVNKRRGGQVQLVSSADVEESVKRLNALESGYKVLNLNNRKVVVSVPQELNADHQYILNLAEENKGFVTMDGVKSKFSWTDARTEAAVHQLLSRGIAWVDTQAQPEEYWLPGLF